MTGNNLREQFKDLQVDVNVVREGVKKPRLQLLVGGDPGNNLKTHNISSLFAKVRGRVLKKHFLSPYIYNLQICKHSQKLKSLMCIKKHIK